MLSKPYLFIIPAIFAVTVWAASPSLRPNQRFLNLRNGLAATSVATDEPNSKTETFDYSLVLKDLKGNNVAMDQFKGKVIFLNEWATWCGPCKAEMPSIQKLYDAVGKDNIIFVMLSRDQPDDTQKIIRYINAKAYTFPVYQPTGDLPKQLNSQSIPATWIISKDGKIVKKEIGMINPNEIKSLLDSEAKK